ncbi:MAG: hypothetical protein ACHQ4H_07680 [Ktedonobacterales bacterium]
MNSATPDPDFAMLPPPLQALYQTLERDGASWRTATPVAMPRLDQLVHELAARPEPGTLDVGLVDGGDTRPSALPTAPRRPIATGARRHADRRRGLVAVAGMAAVVALLALLFRNMLLVRQAAPHQPTPPPLSTATALSTAGPHGQWQALPALAYHSPASASGGPAIAPSNPLVVYEPSPAVGHPATLRRTEDGGKQWTTLALPVNPNDKIVAFEAYASPLDPRTVFLMLDDESYPNGCLAVAAFTLAPAHATSGAGPCFLNYLSTDAGANWHPLLLGGAMAIRGDGNVAAPVVVAQDTRLYASATAVCAQELNTLCARIVTSTDGGLSWFPDDHQLAVNDSQMICDWAAAPSGTTLFAATAATGCSRAPAALSLYRSDDAGLSWARVGRLPTANARGMVVSGGGDAPITLYINLPKTQSYTYDALGYRHPVVSDTAGDLKASSDGGKTWHSAPSAGIPQGLSPGAGPVGRLRDGSLLMPFSVYGNTRSDAAAYFAWSAGSARWRQVAPAPQGSPGVQSVLVTTFGGGDTLWLVWSRAGDPGSEYDVLSCRI